MAAKGFPPIAAIEANHIIGTHRLAKRDGRGECFFGRGLLSKLTDPNDYTGPGTGYALSEQRRAEIEDIRQARTVAELTADQEEHRLPPGGRREERRDVGTVAPELARELHRLGRSNTAADRERDSTSVERRGFSLHRFVGSPGHHGR